MNFPKERAKGLNMKVRVNIGGFLLNPQQRRPVNLVFVLPYCCLQNEVTHLPILQIAIIKVDLLHVVRRMGSPHMSSGVHLRKINPGNVSRRGDARTSEGRNQCTQVVIPAAMGVQRHDDLMRGSKMVAKGQNVWVGRQQWQFKLSIVEVGLGGEKDKGTRTETETRWSMAR